MARVRTEKELGEALKNKEKSIEIEGDLVRKVIRIRAVGDVAWLVAIGAIAVALVGIFVTVPTGGTSAGASFLVAPAAVYVLGSGATMTAMGVAVAAGGVGALNRLRAYKEVSRDGSSLRLVRR